MIYVAAGLLAGLALMYGIGAIGSLALRGVRLALAGKRKLALRCAAYTFGVAISGVVLGVLPTSEGWTSPFYIPLYAGYIVMCNYWANILPKKWQQ